MPKTKLSKLIAFFASPKMVERVDLLAVEEQRSRSEMLRVLLSRGLKNGPAQPEEKRGSQNENNNQNVVSGNLAQTV